MNVSLWLTAAYNAALVGVVLATERLLADAPQLGTEERQGGRVVAIVPARNEARNVERAVGSLLVAAERYGAAAVLVVDDGSADATPERLRALQERHTSGARLRVLRLDEALPDGWLGKPRACWAGATSDPALDAEWLLFVDADTEASPALIGRLVASAEAAGADLYSIVSHQELCSVAERLTMPHIFYALAVAFPWRAVNDPASPIAIANGQCILVRRRVYEALDGHRAVRAAIAEDKALAEQAKAGGFRLRMTDGRDALRVRMYHSLPELWEGWTKNAYLGLGERAWLLLVAVAGGIGGGVVPFVALAVALRARRWRASALWAISIAALLRNRDRAMREFDVPRPYALTLPIGSLLCCAIAFSAWYKVASGQGVTWKGRRYGVTEI